MSVETLVYFFFNTSLTLSSSFVCVLFSKLSGFKKWERGREREKENEKERQGDRRELETKRDRQTDRRRHDKKFITERYANIYTLQEMNEKVKPVIPNTLISVLIKVGMFEKLHLPFLIRER